MREQNVTVGINSVVSAKKQSLHYEHVVWFGSVSWNRRLGASSCSQLNPQQSVLMVDGFTNQPPCVPSVALLLVEGTLTSILSSRRKIKMGKS